MTTAIDPTILFLKGARELLNTPERWTQGFNAKDRDGNPCDAVGPQAVCWCLMGAICCQIEDVYGTTEDGIWPDEAAEAFHHTREYLYNYTGSKALSTVNDDGGYDEVIRVLDEAIATADPEWKPCST